MINKLLKSKKRKESLLRIPNKVAKSTLIGSVIATIIACIPFLFSLHESVPEQRVWNTFLFTYDSTFWEDANYAMWVFTGKAIPLLLLLIWFFSCRHWWYHALLVPIIMYIFQIVKIFSVELRNIDEFEIIYMLPIMAVVIPSIYLIRAQMFSKVTDVDKSLEELEEEFKIKPKSIFQKLGDYF